MAQHYAIGDRVIAMDEQAAGVPKGSMGVVVRVFADWLGICDVQFDDYAGIHAVLMDALAPAPPTSSAKEALP